MRHASLLLLLVLSFAAASRAARGEDVATATRALRDALGPPAAAQGFEFEGYVLEGGAPYGRVHLSAQPHPADAGLWRVRDVIEPIRADGERVLATAVLDRRLVVREAAYHRRNAQGFLRAEVAPREGGFRIEHVTGDYENRLAVGGPEALSTLAAAVLFLRQVPEGPGVYVLDDLDPNPAGGDAYVEPMRFEVHRKAAWRLGRDEREAWIVSLTRGTQTLRLALAPTSRELLGVDFVGLPFQFVPAGAGPVGLTATTGDLRTPLERAVERTRALRSRLPQPAAGLDLRARIFLGATRTKVGIAVLRAEPISLDGRPAWSTVDSRVTRTGEAVVEHEDLAVLATDLRVLRGERVDKRPEGVSHLYFERRPQGMAAIARDAAAQETGRTLLPAPAEATFGLVPVLLFLRQVPAQAATYVLPSWDPRFAAPPKAGSGDFALQAADVHLEVSLEGGSLWARCRTRLGRVWDVELDAATRNVLRVLGRMPALRLEFSSDDTPSEPVDWYDAVEGEPTTWRQGFIRFGRGYHLPRRDLLERAFHWPSMRAQAIAQGRYAQDVAEATVRAAWIDVFVQMSKHRTVGDCDDLLFQIFMTSRETHHADGSVSLTTLPAYGGHTYQLRALEGSWQIVAIDP